jgi:hypothetical protein
MAARSAALSPRDHCDEAKRAPCVEVTTLDIVECDLDERLDQPGIWVGFIA